MINRPIIQVIGLMYTKTYVYTCLAVVVVVLAVVVIRPFDVGKPVWIVLINVYNEVVELDWSVRLCNASNQFTLLYVLIHSSDSAVACGCWY